MATLQLLILYCDIILCHSDIQLILESQAALRLDEVRVWAKACAMELSMPDGTEDMD